MTSRMTLSEAIRLGSLLRPQAFHAHSPEGSCVLRAACEACGITDDHTGLLSYTELSERFPILRTSAACPVCGCKSNLSFFGDVMRACYHLNDQHKWTRAAIADWLDTLAQPTADIPAAEGQPIDGQLILRG